MKESVAIAKEADRKKESSHTWSDNSIQRLRNEPERQLGSLIGVIDNIRRDGGTPSVDSIATELSSMHTAQRAPALLALQRTHGNRYVQRVVAGIQAKLAVGQPGDIYEQEADRVAEAVMRMPEPQVQRQAEEEEKKKKEEELIQPKENSSGAIEVTPGIENSINSLRGGGQPLPESVRNYFEPRFGYDFSQVRVHTDAEADTLSRALSARAFTTGQDLFFRRGEYKLGSRSGQELLAHELTHIMQQRSITLRKGEISLPGSPAEVEADRVGRKLLSGNGLPILNAPTAMILRELTPEQRRRIEARTGPLEAPLAGPPGAQVTEVDKRSLRDVLRVCLNTRNDAASHEVADWVRDHDHEPNYRPLVVAVIAAPLGILGAALGGPATIGLAVASAAVSIVSNVPNVSDPVGAFRDRMRDAFAIVYENRRNSVDTIVDNYLIGVPPEIAGNLQRMRVDFVSQCFRGASTGEAVNGTVVGRRVREELNQKWMEAERAHQAVVQDANDYWRFTREVSP